MIQFKRQITATAGAILIALGLIGINADRAIAQVKTRNGAKARSIISPRDIATGQSAGIRVNKQSRGRNPKGSRHRDGYITSDKLKSNAKLRRSGNSLLGEEPIYYGKVKSNAKLAPYLDMSSPYGAKRRRARNGKGRASYDIRRPKP